MPSPGAERLRDDATLNDVTFVGGGLGWAVGNRGAILHSRDGGLRWETQSSGTDATLEAVHFANEKVGIVVGGMAGHDGGGCYGVVLRTEDGGRRWHRLGGAQTGWLHAVWTNAEGRGWVAGDPTPMHASGLWRLDASAARIVPVGDRPTPGFLAACFRDDGRGIAVGRGGTCTILRAGRQTPQRRGVSFQGRLTGVATAGDRRACMVGDDGAIFASRDEGRTWSAVALDVPAGLRELIDLTDVAFADARRGWATGANGRYVLATVDGAETWRVHTTDLPVPLRSLTAIDARTVVGVGDGGLIARSADGGKTWSATRNGDRRIAVLAVSTPSQRWVWPTMAHLVGRNRCRVAYLRAVVDDVPSGALRYAANACGVSFVQVLTDFDLPRAAQGRSTTSPTDAGAEAVGDRAGLFRYWSRLLDRDAETAMRRQIVAAVRNLRPAIVVIDDAQADVVAASVAWLTADAVEKAGRSEVMSEQHLIGLTPHRVQRVLGFDDGREKRPRRVGELPAERIRIGFAEGFCSLLESTCLQAGLRARGVLGLPLDSGDLSAGFRIVGGDPPTKRVRTPLTGVRLPSGARHVWVPVEDASRTARLSSVSEGLLATCKMAARRGDPSKLVQMAMTAAREFPDALAPADALYQAARQYEQAGRHRTAAQVWNAFLTVGGSHPAWASQVVRRLTIRASAEHYMSLPVRPDDPLAGARSAVAGLDQLCAERPHLAHRPDVLFAWATCLRVLSRVGPARRFYRLCAAGDAAGWSTAASAELWLLDSPDVREETCPRRLVEARRAANPVVIDGRLDEPVWQGGSAPLLRGTTGAPPDETSQTRVRFAWDERYLYLAATVRTTHGRPGPPAGHAPMRDRLHPDWPAVEWFIDVDRDAATYYRLGVDEIGNVLDARDNDLSLSLPMHTSQRVGAWQYVVRHDRDAWHVEMAIPMVSIMPRPPSPGQVWAVQTVRRPAHSDPPSLIQWLNPQPAPDPMPQHFALLLLVGVR